jgi:hypothetical protein
MTPDLFRRAEPAEPQRIELSLERLEVRLKLAAQIAKEPTREGRELLWQHVPPVWRKGMAYNVALLLAPSIATLEDRESRRAALTELPDDLQAEVEVEARRVYYMRAHRRRNEEHQQQ